MPMRLTILAAVALMAACAVGEDVSPIPMDGNRISVPYLWLAAD